MGLPVNLLNLARMTTATSGTGTMTLGSAVSGYLTFALAGAVDGKRYTYAIYDAAGASEIGRGIYTASGTTMSRVDVLASTNGGSKISLSGSAEVFITAAAEDFSEFQNSIELAFAEQAMQVADLLNVATFLGTTGNRYADSFDALTYVGSGTNVDTGTAGLLKPTVTSTRVTGGTPTVSGGGTAANINDNNTGTTISWAPGNISGSAINSRILAKLDYGSNKTITKIEVKSYLETFSGTHVGPYYSTDGTNWTALGSNWATTTSAADYSNTGSVTARYIAVIAIAADFTGNTLTLGDLNGYENVTASATAVSTGLTAASAPSAMKIVAMVNHVESATAGTDYKFKVSRDAGSHLSAYLTLTDRHTLPGGSIHVVESDWIDVTTITSGTTPYWQWETFGKSLELMGLYLYWQ